MTEKEDLKRAAKVIYTWPKQNPYIWVGSCYQRRNRPSHCQKYIQALKELGKDEISAKEKGVIIALLKKEEQHRLVHDIRLAPEWIRIITRQAISKKWRSDMQKQMVYGDTLPFDHLLSNLMVIKEKFN